MPTVKREPRELILVVDDDPLCCEIVRRLLDENGYAVEIFHSGEDCLTALTSSMPIVICLDMHLPGLSGLETLKRIQKTHPYLPVIFLTGETEVDTVVTAIQLGAFDYLLKPVDPPRVLTQIRNAVEKGRMSMQIAQLQREAEGSSYPGLIGRSEAMVRLQRQMDRLSSCDTTVLIFGESGSGKELVARGIHQASGRRDEPFIAVNCAAIPESLQEAELFGHEKGAFTGATEQRIGCFEQADGGTLLLDEIGELSDSQQAKLLRTLQERRFRRVVGRREIQSDFRLLAATHRHLEEGTRDGSFREDLFFRIAVFELEIPPLRLRLTDIPVLADYFVEKYAGERAEELLIDTLALQILQEYHWPGNVRELENVIQHALIVTAGNEILPEHLPNRVLQPQANDNTIITAPERGQLESRHGLEEPFSFNLEEIEKYTIAAAIKKSEGNLSKAGRLLGISRSSVYRKIQRYEI